MRIEEGGADFVNAVAKLVGSGAEIVVKADFVAVEAEFVDAFGGSLDFGFCGISMLARTSSKESSYESIDGLFILLLFLN